MRTYVTGLFIAILLAWVMCCAAHSTPSVTFRADPYPYVEFDGVVGLRGEVTEGSTPITSGTVSFKQWISNPAPGHFVTLGSAPVNAYGCYSARLNNRVLYPSVDVRAEYGSGASPMLTIKVVKGSWQKIDNWSGSGTQSWDITVEPGRGDWHIQYVCPSKTAADEADLSGSKRWQVDTIGQVKDNGAMQNSGYYPLTAADTGEGHGGETSTYNVTWKWVSSGGVFDAYSPSKGLMTIQGDLTTRVDAKIPTQPPTTDYGYAAALSVASSTLCGVITSAVSTAAPNVEVWEPKAPVDNAVSLTETVVGGQVNRSYSLRAFGSTNISGPGGSGSKCNYDSVAFVSTNVQKYLPSSQ